MQAPGWQFPHNPNRKTVGFNNQGVSHFTGDRFRNVIRETVQNSGDAVRDAMKPVVIKMSSTYIPVHLLDGDGLKTTLARCLETSKVPSDKPILQKMADDVRQSCEIGAMPALVVSDHNTIGASDIVEEGALTSMWDALTNAEGVDVKPTKGSAGSHGLGKNAPYNISTPRTVLYSTRFRTEAEGDTRNLFIGRALLVSHQGVGGEYYTHEGYLGAPDFYPLENGQIDPFFQRDDEGLTLYIAGFTPPPDEIWETMAAQAAIENFFHGIVKGKLIFDIEGKAINSDSIRRRWIDELSDLQSETVNFMRVSTSPPVDTCHIDGIGEVNLYLETSDDDEDNRREIALVRDSGMLITNQLTDMNLPGMKRHSSLPRNLKGFTAIIECLSHGNDSLVKDAETANHTAVRVDTIEDMARRKFAEKQLGRLGRWVKQQLQERARREVVARVENADELNDLVSLIGDAISSGDQTIPPTDHLITQPHEVASGVTASALRRGRRSKTIELADEPDDNQETEEKQHDKRKRQKRTTRRKRNTRSLPNPFAGLRFVRTSNDATHEISAIFDSPSEALRGVRLMSISEDGSESVVGLKNQVEINGKKATVKNNAVRLIEPVASQTRVVIKFDTQEPVVIDGNTLKSFNLKHGETHV